MAVEGISSGLMFQAAGEIARQQNAQASKQEKAEKVKKGSFISVFEKSQKEMEVLKEGFPKEIADMEMEDAVRFLKDEADMACDVLREHQTPETFADYRKKLSQFMKYISRNNFEVRKKMRKGFNRNGKPKDPYVIVRVINQNLDEIAKWLLSTHRDGIKILSKLEENKGLIVDLMAD